MGFDNQKLLESLLCRMMKHVAPPKGLAEDLPMQYAGFPVRVCVNDQLDRFFSTHRESLHESRCGGLA